MKAVTEPPIVSIVGPSGVGKTTLLERLIPELTGRGYRVGTIKHDVHGFEIDQPGKDSWRHKHAGAQVTVISSPNQIGMVMDVDHDHHLEELKRLFEERLKEQNERHDGGNKWIGTGGTSPFGDLGFHPSGISFGAQHRQGRAMKLAIARRYKNYRHDLTLDIRQIQVALKKLRRLKRIGCEEELDLEVSVGRIFNVASHVYDAPTKRSHIILLCYLCEASSSKTKNVEVADAKWIRLGDLDRYDFALADLPVVAQLKSEWESASSIAIRN